MRLVVVGGGMVGARLVEDLVAGDGDGRFTITVLGDEPGPSYNRVLLSEVVAGRASEESIRSAPLTHPRVRHVTAAATRIDRQDRVVVDSAGERHRYDFLVLATGAAARVPEVPGLDPLPGGVHVLRSLADAREVVAGCADATRAVVVGGGVLGLEVATGLRGRGLGVSVVHPGGSVMDRQLDAGAGGVVDLAMDDLGIGRHLGVGLAQVRSQAGSVTGVGLSDERVVPTDLVVITAGTQPRTGLAERAGLPVRRGIVVGDDLASLADRRVFAIGDCAEPSEGGSGLVAQGWAQAERLVHRLLGRTGAGATAAPAAPDDVVKVKSATLDVVTMGLSGPGARRPDDRALTLSDPGAGRHLEVVVRDGRLVAATCVGAGELATRLVLAYTQREPVPADPAHLLLPVRQPVAAPADPGAQVVCRCTGVSRARIEQAVADGAQDVAAVSATTRAATGCGGCRDEVCALVRDLTAVPAEA